MKIATFNINNVNRRLQNLIDWLAIAKPHIICLQELKAAQGDFPEAALNNAGYHCAWVGQKTWNGVALLSRRDIPVVTRTRLPGARDDTQARYLEAAIGGMIVAALYLPNGNPQPGPKFDYKLDWFKRLTRHAHSLVNLEAPVILAGDYNVAPTPQDIYQTNSWENDALVQPESRAAYTKLLKQGWLDSIRARHPKKPMYTFWDYKRRRWERDAGLRLDHLLLNRSAAERLINAGVDRWVRGEEGASDHAPAWLTLKRL